VVLAKEEDDTKELAGGIAQDTSDLAQNPITTMPSDANEHLHPTTQIEAYSASPNYVVDRVMMGFALSWPRIPAGVVLRAHMLGSRHV